jgi:hypothetical protein
MRPGYLIKAKLKEITKLNSKSSKIKFKRKTQIAIKKNKSGIKLNEIKQRGTELKNKTTQEKD